MKTAASQAVSNAAEARVSLSDDQITPDPALALATDGVIRPLPNRPSRQRLRRSLAVLAALIAGLLASAATVPAAFATIPDPGGAAGDVGFAQASAPAVRVVVTGGMAGWQITSIAIGSALFTATAAVLLYRALAVRKAASAATA